MGEAKRRKQLGLMPQIENHDVILHRDGSVSDHALPGAVMQRLSTWAETGERWDARYRTSFIGTGLPRELLKTEDELMDIPVPERMRLRLGLLSGSPAWLEREREHNPDAFFEDDDGQTRRLLNVRATEYDYNGQWAELPDFEAGSTLRYLMQHPAVTAPPKGESYAVTVWRGGERAGQVTFEPQPAAEHQEAMAQAAIELLGDTDEAWMEDHLNLLADAPDGEGLTGSEGVTAGEDPAGGKPEGDQDDQGAAPLARRTALLLSPVPLVLSPGVQVLARSGEMDIVFDPQAEAYSLGGDTWSDYPLAPDNSDKLQALLESMGVGDLSGLAELMAQQGDEPEEGGPDSRTIEAEVVGREPQGSDGGDASGKS